MAGNLKGRIERLSNELHEAIHGPPKLIINTSLPGPNGEVGDLETGCWWVTTDPPYQWGIPPLGPNTVVYDITEFILAAEAVEQDEIELHQRAEALCRRREEYLERRFGRAPSGPCYADPKRGPGQVGA